MWCVEVEAVAYSFSLLISAISVRVAHQLSYSRKPTRVQDRWPVPVPGTHWEISYLVTMTLTAKSTLAVLPGPTSHLES